MKSFIYKWFWEGKQKWSVLLSLLASFIWFFIYIAFVYFKSDIAYEFYWGYLVKSLVIAPLLLIPFSRLTSKVWLAVSAFFVPYALQNLLFNTPDHGMIFNKLSMNKFFGLVYLTLTILIIILVPLVQWVYRKVKGR